jgi:hypothetical protein
MTRGIHAKYVHNARDSDFDDMAIHANGYEL